MSAEDLEKYETEMELKLYREYRDVVGLFKYVIETERRFYLTNDYEMQVHSVQGEVFFEVSMADAWVWDMYRPARFVKQVRVLTFKDVNIEEPQQERSGTSGRLTPRCPLPGRRYARCRNDPVTRVGGRVFHIRGVVHQDPHLGAGRVTVGAGGGADMNARGHSGGTARTWRHGCWPKPGWRWSSATGAVAPERSTSWRGTATPWSSAR